MIEIDLKYVKLKNSKTILHDIQFKIFSNKIYTIIGKNGSGKTTLIKALTSLLDKNQYSLEGQVIFNDKDLLSIPGNELEKVRKNNIKYVFQDSINSFDPLKTFKYYFNKIAVEDKEINELLSYFILPLKDELFKLYPYEVSGGMAQRINFVLALLAQPQFIIMDEPTSGIDSAIANLFIEKIREFAVTNKNAILLVTHDLNFAKKVSDEIAYLSDGLLTNFSSPEIFFKQNGNKNLNYILDSYKQLIL